MARRRVLLVLVAGLVGALGTGCSGRTPAMMSGGAGARHMSQLTCSAPLSLPGSTVYVMVGDMGMTSVMGGVAPLGARMLLRAVPARVPVGQVSFVVGNRGWRTHEIVVLPLGPGQAAGQRVPGSDGRVDEIGSVGEVSASCVAGSGEGVEPGTTGWVTLSLPAGRYELLCNLRNHYADGMFQTFVVS